MPASLAACSAPGKLILMGEHAAVYGRPALVAAVNLRLRVSISAANRGEIDIDLPQIGHRESTTWESIREYTRSTRSRWQRYAADPSARAFQELRGDDPAHLVKLALGEAADFLDQKRGPACRLRIDSELPIGSGLGSSAATAVGVLAVYLAWCGTGVEDRQLHHLSLEVERRQHGMPSGIDNATVRHGGIVWARKTGSGALELEPLAAHSPLLDRMRIFDSGRPAEPTGAVVAAVRDWGRRRPRRFSELLQRMEQLTVELRRLLTGPEADGRLTVDAIRGYQACLEELEVVPEPVRRRIRQIEAGGGAAKISGAGSLRGPGAGMLLVYHPEADIADWDCLRGLAPLPVGLGADGLRQEEP